MHVEDSADDSALVMSALRRGGFEPSCERVDTAEAFKDAIRSQHWDVIISDYALPGYNGLTALADLKEGGADIPFILVSGTVGEVGAVNAMKAGAQDYVLKDSLGRLPLAVEREIRDTGLRKRQREMSEQLVISERMASAGMLAAGVAHEINNPLAVVAANLELVATLLAQLASSRAGEKASPVGERLKELDGPLLDAREALVRIEAIVRDVKLFSRPQDAVRSTVDVKSVIESSIRLAGNEIRHRARLVEDYGDVQMVDSNEARLGQVVLNLLVNAAQAMPEGRASQNEIRVKTRMGSGNRVVIEVTDTGMGIPKDILPRIFDPFFTTKPIGVGTGLGLSLCHRMVTDLGGEIAVESEVGTGTLVRVTLPAATNTPMVAKPIRVAEGPTRRARVLIIDDEPAIGRTLARSLGSRHDVVTLTSGKEALARISAGERFDAILSDLMMPEVTGMEIHQELSRFAPDQAQRMIFLTGGAFTEDARNFLSVVQNARVDKPFDIAEILTRIDRVAGTMMQTAPTPSFDTLLAPFDVSTLNDDPSTIYG
ncbi:MAG: response regulator, partial [Polyangiaceae bacterium]